MNVVALFNRTDTMLAPWAQAGFTCYSVDTQHPVGETREGNIVRVGADVRHWLPPRGPIAFMAAFTPCTHMAVSGARWFKGKGLRLLSESIELFARSAELCEWSGAPYLIENPVSTISTYWRKPDYTFDPCDFAGYEGGEADTYTKHTCLWVGGGFHMPQKRRRDPLNSRMHLLPPSDERADLRAATPPGFARAVFDANVPQSWRKSA